MWRYHSCKCCKKIDASIMIPLTTWASIMRHHTPTPPAWLRQTFTSLIHRPAPPTATAAHRGLAPSLWRSSSEWICSNPREVSPRLYSHHFVYSGIPPAEGGCWMSEMNEGGGGGVGWRACLQTSQWSEYRRCFLSEPVLRRWFECLPINYKSW